MKNSTNKAAAAKIAAAANSNKVNKETKKAAAVCVKLSAAQLAAAAKDTAENCTTCKQVATNFAALVEKYGKDTAIMIQSAAKEIVNTRKAETTAAAVCAVDTLKDGQRIGRAAWDMLCKDKTSGGAFARVLFDMCNKDLAALVVRFASFVGTDSDGRKVAAVRKTTKIDGKIVEKYMPRDLSKVAGYLAALKLAVKNGKRAALGAKVSDYQTEVVF